MKSDFRRAWREKYPRDPGVRQRCSARVVELLRASSEFKNAEQVALFAAQPWEIDLAGLWNARPEACVLPRVEGDRLHFHFVKSWADLKVGYKGILEPPATAVPAGAFRETDLLLVPGLAFDRFGGRIGSGKGFYDRFLPTVSGQFWAVGYEQQIFDGELAQEPLDVRMGAIVTERGIFRVTR